MVDYNRLPCLRTGFTYTALKNARMALETKGIDPKDTVAEVTLQATPEVTLGAKLAAPWCPEVGLQAVHGPFFASIFAKALTSCQEPFKG